MSFQHTWLVAVVCGVGLASGAERVPMVCASTVCAQQENLAELETQVRRDLCDGSGRVRKVLFSPCGGIERSLLNLIALEKKRISFAVYAFTNPRLADALIRAHQRGVKVEGVICGSTLSDSNCQMPRLVDAGINAWVYCPEQGKRSLMHNKFMIFSDVLGREIVESGSYNYTGNAERVNQENAGFVDHCSASSDEDNIPAVYAERFSQLCADSVRVHPLPTRAVCMQYAAAYGKKQLVGHA